MKTEKNVSVSSGGQTSSLRISRKIFCFVMIIISIFLIWPGYPFFSSATPLILGFPLSFAWVILCTIAGFIAMLALYQSDKKTQRDQ